MWKTIQQISPGVHDCKKEIGVTKKNDHEKGKRSQNQDGRKRPLCSNH